MSQGKNYIDKKEFFNRICKYQDSGKLKIPNDLAIDFMKLCNNIGKHRWFRGYPYVDDAILEGILECVRRINNFDRNKTTNAFGYFTQVAWNSFRRFIIAEKKQLEIKIKAMEHLEMKHLVYDKQPGDDNIYDCNIKLLTDDNWKQEFIGENM